MLFLLKPESRFRPVISLAKYSLVASQARAKSCRVATRRLFLRFCRENFNSGDFFLAIFSPVASPVRGWLHVRFSSRAGDATKFEKIASPARAKNRSCSRGLTRSSFSVAHLFNLFIKRYKLLQKKSLIITFVNTSTKKGTEKRQKPVNLLAVGRSVYKLNMSNERSTTSRYTTYTVGRYYSCNICKLRNVIELRSFRSQCHAHYVKVQICTQWPFLFWRTHYPSRRTWANIRCSSGYSSLV